MSIVESPGGDEIESTEEDPRARESSCDQLENAALVEFLAQRDEEVSVLPRYNHASSNELFTGDTALNNGGGAAAVAVRSGRRVWEMWRGDEEARKLARILATGATAHREVHAGPNPPRWLHASSPDPAMRFAGVAKFESIGQGRIAAIAVIEATRDRAFAFAEAQRMADDIATYWVDDDYAIAGASEQLRRTLNSGRQKAREEDLLARCCDCHARMSKSVLAACPGRACNAPLCKECCTVSPRNACSTCIRRDNTRKKLFERLLTDGLPLERLGETFGVLSCQDDGRLKREHFTKLICGSVRVLDDDDPLLAYDGFDQADRDDDGLLDFEDVVTWLQTHLDARRRRQHLSLRDDLEVDRSAFAAWPSFEGSAVLSRETPRKLLRAKLDEGKLTLTQLPESVSRVVVVHPSLISVERISSTEIKMAKPASKDELEESVTLDLEDAAKCANALTALSETLAVCRRLKQPVLTFATDAKDDAIFFSRPRASVLSGAFGELSRAIDQVFVSSNDAVHTQHKRRSMPFSDANEIEVSRGWAFDRVKTADGRISWEAAAPRRAKEAYRAVVKLVVRPQRAEYNASELGPRFFEIRQRQYVRSDFRVQQPRGGKRWLACSLWRRLDKPSPLCVLYAHGNASCRLEALPHVAPLLLLGISVCAFDASGSGHSDGDFISLGYRESADCAQVARHLIASSRATKVGLFGRSMGAVVAILAAARYADFGGAAPCVVADSPFASLDSLINNLARSAAASAFRVPLPEDIAEANKAIDQDYVEQRDSMAFATNHSEAHDADNGPSNNEQPVSRSWAGILESLNPATALGGARSALAEAAARAAIDSVRAEVEKRAGFETKSVDVMAALQALDSPLLLVASEGDTLVPPRANAGKLLDTYLLRRARTNNMRLEAQIVVCKGGHNAKRPLLAKRKIYYFLARHLLQFSPKRLRDAMHQLQNYADHIANHSPPWHYDSQQLPRAADAAGKHTPKSPDADFVSGMTDERHRCVAKEISNLYTP